MKVRSFLGHLVGSAIGLIFSIAIWIALNITAAITGINFIQDIAGFVNSNLYLFVIAAVLGFIARAFDLLIFPLSLIAPFFHALNSIFILVILFRSLAFINIFFESSFIDSFLESPLKFFIYLFVSSLSLFVGLVSKVFPQDSAKSSKSNEESFSRTVRSLRKELAKVLDSLSSWLKS